MAVSRGNGQNGGHYYSNITQPIKLDMQFTVTPTNGLGITSLKSNGYVNNVFMHTSTTPSSNNGYLNPNPINGYALVQLNNNYNKFLGMLMAIQSPNSGTPINVTAGLSVGTVYTITSVGTTTTAAWQVLGLPPGFTPTAGQSFVAKTASASSGTGVVQVPAAAGSGIVTAEVVGDPNQMIANTSIAVNAGAWVLVRFMSAASAAPTFTGSALGTHTHDFTVIGGQAASTTNNIANYAGPLLGKEQATNATYLGSASATNGGVVAVSAGTPAGTISAPATALAIAAPATGSIISLSMFMDASSVTIDGL